MAAKMASTRPVFEEAQRQILAAFEALERLRDVVGEDEVKHIAQWQRDLAANDLKVHVWCERFAR